jgi:predicted aspartyl protease
MQITVRGKVQVPIRIENLGDALNVTRGFFKIDFIRAVEVPDALVASGTSCFALPARFVKELKLQRRGTRKAHTADGFAFFGIYEPVRIYVLDRDCSVDVIKVPDGCPVLLGSLPLKLLDLVEDEANGRLIGNPDHDGHPLVDLC